MEVVLSRGLRVLKVKEKISIYISNIVEITKKKKKKELGEQNLQVDKKVM